MTTVEFNSAGFTALSEKKSGSVTVIEEIHISEEPWMCSLPVTEAPVKKVEKKFKCEVPAIDPNVTRVRDPLPFPDKLEDVIAWTDAFVDRIASLTAKEQKVRTSHIRTICG